MADEIARKLEREFAANPSLDVAFKLAKYRQLPTCVEIDVNDLECSGHWVHKSRTQGSFAFYPLPGGSLVMWQGSGQAGITFAPGIKVTGERNDREAASQLADYPGPSGMAC